MADNYLEKRQASYREQASRALVKRSAASVVGLAQRGQAAAFDASYSVRPDQLSKMVEAARVVGSLSVQCLIVPESAAPALARECCALASPCGAYILLGVSCAADTEALIAVGRCLQMMLLQASEMGLSVAVTFVSDAPRAIETLALPFEPSVLLAVGRAAK